MLHKKEGTKTRRWNFASSLFENWSNGFELDDDFYIFWLDNVVYAFKIVKVRKFQIVTRFGWRVTILQCREHVLKGVQSWHDFGKTWHDFRLAGHVLRIRLIVPWIVRINRVTIW